MNKTNAKRLEVVKRFFGKYEEGYGLASDDIEWLIGQAERVQKLEEASKKFESSMDYEIVWQERHIKSGKRRQFHIGAASGMRNVKRQWEAVCQALNGGELHDTNKA